MQTEEAKPESPVLTLPNGTQVFKGGSIEKPRRKFVEVPSNKELQKKVVEARRKIVDLPCPPEMANPLMVVIYLTVFGIDDAGIADHMKCSIDQVLNMRALDAYKQLENEFLNRARDFFQSEIKSKLSQAAHVAADRLTELVHDEDGKVAVQAVKTALEYEIGRPSDVVEHRFKMEGGLRIEVIRKDEKSPNMPTIDITPKEIKNA